MLEFDMGEATDDLTCRTSTGQSAFISATRAMATIRLSKDFEPPQV
jgi:hypothetical protein